MFLFMTFVVVLSFCSITVVIYFIPTIFAKLRNHHNTRAIFVVNLFLGWSLIGWVVALAWSLTQTNRPCVCV